MTFSVFSTVSTLQGLAGSYLGAQRLVTAVNQSSTSTHGTPQSNPAYLFSQRAEAALDTFVDAMRHSSHSVGIREEMGDDYQDVAASIYRADLDKIRIWCRLLDDIPIETQESLNRALFEAADCLSSHIRAHGTQRGTLGSLNTDWLRDGLALGVSAFLSPDRQTQVLDRSQATLLYEPAELSLENAPALAFSAGGQFYCVVQGSHAHIYESGTNRLKVLLSVPQGFHPKRLIGDGRYLVGVSHMGARASVWDLERQIPILEYDGDKRHGVGVQSSDGGRTLTLFSKRRVSIYQLAEGHIEQVYDTEFSEVDEDPIIYFNYFSEQGIGIILTRAEGILLPPRILKMRGDRFLPGKRLEYLPVENSQDTPELSRVDYAKLRLVSPPPSNLTAERPNNSDSSRQDPPSYASVSSDISIFAAPSYDGVEVSSDGVVILTHRSQGMGDDRGGGNFASNIDVMSMFSRKHRATINIPNDTVNRVAISPDKNLIASASPRAIYVFDVSHPDEPLFALNHHQGYIGALEFINNRTLISGGRLGDVLKWDLIP